MGLIGNSRNYSLDTESGDSDPKEGLSWNRVSYKSDTESDYSDQDAFTCVLIASNFERGLVNFSFIAATIFRMCIF